MRLRVCHLKRFTEYRREDAEGRVLYRWRNKDGRWEGRAAIGEPWVGLVWSRVPPDVRARHAEAVVG